ncbi:MAG: hypothetical protein MR967_04435 [Holdemanella sp.]|uniref:hypothetical protein n=1 Tax=Holdemanella sp. TaxID=1971762 RepID=UPI002587D41F|nr:hypothetical protein [Holdemanella sp.]MCI7166175.1 hypothetical protein [Holdemanella sp.]
MEMKITNECYEYVKISLETYNCLNKQINTLSKLYAKEQEEKKEIEDKVTELTCEIEILRQEIMKSNINGYRLEAYTLEECLDFNGWNYAFTSNEEQKLLNLGFTHEELNQYIEDEWKKLNCVQEEENE